MSARRCVICGASIEGKHAQATTCSPRCRKAKERALRREAAGLMVPAGLVEEALIAADGVPELAILLVLEFAPRLKAAA